MLRIYNTKVVTVSDNKLLHWMYNYPKFKHA